MIDIRNNIDREFKDEEWFRERPKHRFSDIVGYSSVIERLAGAVSAAKNDKIQQYVKTALLQSYFFYSLPGSGRKFIIEAFVAELMEYGYRYVYVDGSQLVSRKVGGTEKNINSIFRAVKNAGKCILFVDGIDMICSNLALEDVPIYVRGWTREFLTGYSDLYTSEGDFILITATNYPKYVNEALLDCSQLVCIDTPDFEARTHMFKVKLQDKIALEEGFAYEELAERAKGYDYYDLNRVLSELMQRVFIELRIQFADDEQAIEAMENGSFRLTRQMVNEVFAKFEPSKKENISELL